MTHHQDEHSVPATSRTEQDIQHAVHTLYIETDMPKPTVTLPIAPLGPLLQRLQIGCVEIAGLTAKTAEAFLLRRRVIGQPLDLPSDESDAPLAGFLYAAGSGAFLFVEAHNPVVRRRFSVAHELGHFIMHFRPELARWRESLEAGQPISGSLFDAFSAGDADREDDGVPRDKYNQRESEADAFAAALLMPCELLQGRAKELRREMPALPPSGLSDRLAMDLLVSRQAMERRIRALGGLQCTVTEMEGIHGN